MEQNETVIEHWSVRADQVIFPAILLTAVLFFTFILSFLFIFIISRSTNIVALIFPILAGLIFLASLPELFKSLKVAPESSEVFLTDRGVYSGVGQEQENYKFIPWEQMNGYDMHYSGSSSFLGKFFPRPTEFFLKSKYEEDNFVVPAFGEHVDTLRAYLKENNVPFGFLKK